MSTSITDNVDELFDLVRKSEGIISTYEARDLESEPESVEDDYTRYAQTHVSLGDTSDFEADITESIAEGENPTKGYLYGKYGYGKTSTSVSIWNTLSENDVIAVPPFTLDSFYAVMQATYGWMWYEFDHKARDEHVEQLEAIHNRYLQQEIESVAQEGEQFDLDSDKLARFLEEQDDHLNLSINADILIDFFDDCTELALDAGFEALVVIGDEFQEYFNSADNEKDAESRFRQLVFGLQSGAQIRGEFGLFVSMPESTKSMLDSRAEDILNRLQRDNLALNLGNVYGRDFPLELWSEYAVQFNFEDHKHEIITKHALKAAGEVCSRNDLSNGPRTVMDIFRLALLQYRNKQEAFTAYDLADAFYQGDVRYQGSGTKIQTAIGDALDHSSVDTGDKKTFLKICAVFPEEGIQEALVEEYDLEDARTALSKKLHGEVIKVIAEGYTLTDVTKTETIDPIRELIRDFWRDYSIGHVAAEQAVDALANKLVNGTILEAQRGTLDGWTNGGNDLNKLNHTAYRDQFEGTFDTRFPKRRISVGVCDDSGEEKIIEEHGSLGEKFGDPDLALNFMLRWQNGGDDATHQHINAESDREYTFVLDGRQSFDELPKGLDFLRNAMDPKAVTPFLMLALVHYLDDPHTDLDAQQENRVESFQQSLLNQSLKALFDEELVSNAPFDLRRTGKRSVSGVFTSAMEDLYPDYHTVITSTQYRDVMEDYADFLGTIETRSQRRGTETVVEETPEDGGEDGKHRMARRFGLRQTSSFGNRLKKHYSDLLTRVDTDVDHYEVRAELHPFEQEILDRLEDGEDDTLSVQKVEELALEMGYRDEEIDVISSFMGKRGIVGMTENGGALVLEETEVSIEAVEQAVEECRDQIDAIGSLDSNRIPDGAVETVEELDEELDRTNPEKGEKLEALQVEAEHIIDRLDEVGELLFDHYTSQCAEAKREAERTRRSLIPDHLEDEVTSGVEFVGGLNDARTELLARYRELRGDLSDIIDDLEQAQNNHDIPSLEAAVTLHDQVESARSSLESIDEDAEDLGDYATELKRWRTFTDKVGNIKEDIQDYSRTFDESIPEETEITEFIAEIRERLVDNDPLETLKNRKALDERLEDIEESYQQRRNERREVFNEKQSTLNDILQDATDGRAANLRVTFDVKQPKESRRQLFDDFRQEFESQVLDQAEDRLETAHNEVEYAQIVEVEAATDADPDRIGEEIEQAQATLRSLRGKLSRFEFEDIGEETDLPSEGAELLTTAEELQQEAHGFRAPTEPDSDEIQDLLERVEANSDPDFKELLMEYHDDGEPIDVDELLERMEQLFKLNQIDITIKERRGRR